MLIYNCIPTRCVVFTADVFSGHQDGHIVMVGVLVMFRVQLHLPFAKWIQGCICICGHLQVWGSSHFDYENDLHHNYFDVVSDRRIHVQRWYLFEERSWITLLEFKIYFWLVCFTLFFTITYKICLLLIKCAPTMFIIVSKYFSSLSDLWNSVMDLSATSKTSTCLGLLTDRGLRFELSNCFLLFCKKENYCKMFNYILLI